MFWNKGTIIACTIISMALIIVTSMLVFASISPAADLRKTVEPVSRINFSQPYPYFANKFLI